MLSFIIARFFRKPAAIVVPPAPYVCRDHITNHIIASGTLADMQAFQIAFGTCGIYPNAA